MNKNIRIKYDEDISGYIVDMPEFITLSSIDEWIERFGIELNSIPPGQHVVMLVNTNQHKFESIQCLKRLREFFTNNPVIRSNGVKIAFVQPRQYREPHEKSKTEAYFESSKEAYEWLKGC